MKNKSHFGQDCEAVWQPLIRIEATFRPAAGFEDLSQAKLGDPEGIATESVVRVEAETEAVEEENAASE